MDTILSKVSILKNWLSHKRLSISFPNTLLWLLPNSEAWLTSGEWGCSLDNGPKLVVGQPNDSFKTKKIFFFFFLLTFWNLFTKMAVNKSTFQALVVLELINSDEETEEKSNGRGKTRNWIKKREELGYYPNIKHKLRMEDTDMFKEIIRMGFEHFKEILNLIKPDIFPQEVVSGNKVSWLQIVWLWQFDF